MFQLHILLLCSEGWHRRASSCHTFRHSYAAHLLENGHGIRTVQELLDHNDRRISRGGVGLGPADCLLLTATGVEVSGGAIRSPVDSLEDKDND